MRVWLFPMTQNSREMPRGSLQLAISPGACGDPEKSGARVEQTFLGLACYPSALSTRNRESVGYVGVLTGYLIDNDHQKGDGIFRAGSQSQIPESELLNSRYMHGTRSITTHVRKSVRELDLGTAFLTTGKTLPTGGKRIPQLPQIYTAQVTPYPNNLWAVYRRNLNAVPCGDATRDPPPSFPGTMHTPSGLTVCWNP